MLITTTTALNCMYAIAFNSISIQVTYGNAHHYNCPQLYLRNCPEVFKLVKTCMIMHTCVATKSWQFLRCLQVYAQQLLQEDNLFSPCAVAGPQGI